MTLKENDYFYTRRRAKLLGMNIQIICEKNVALRSHNCKMRLFWANLKNFELNLTVQFRSPTLNIRNPSQDKKRLPTWLIAWSCDNNR